MYLSHPSLFYIDLHNVVGFFHAKQNLSILLFFFFNNVTLHQMMVDVHIGGN